MSVITAVPLTARPLTARPLTAMALGVSADGGVDPLVWHAATYDPTTFELQAQRVGTGTPTFTSSAMLLPDWEGKYVTVAANTAPWHGARQVNNRIGGSNNCVVGGRFSAFGGATSTLVAGGGPSGQDCWEWDCTSTKYVINYLTSSEGNPGAGNVVTLSALLRSSTGSSITARIHASSTDYTAVTLTTAWQRISITKTLTSGGTFSVRNATGLLEICEPQYELVSGQSNTNPGVYVENTSGTAAASKYYANQNGNTVSSDVVTEATGAVLSTLPSLYGAPSYTNSLTYSNDLTNAAWAKTNTGSVAFTAAGITGAPNSASVVTDSDAAARYYLSRATGTITSGVLRLFILKDVAATKWIYISADGDGANWRGFFNPNTGVFNSTTGFGTNQIVTVSIGGVDWYQLLLYGSGKSGLVTSYLYLEPASSSNGSAHDVTATGAVTIGNIEYHAGKTIAQVLGMTPIITAASTVTTSAVTDVMDSANWDDTAGGLYMRVTSQVAQNILSTFLSVTGSNFQLSDGTNTATKAWVTNTAYEVGIAWDSTANTMALCVDSVWSANATYDDTLLSGALDFARSASGVLLYRGVKRWTAADLAAGKALVDAEMAA